MPREPSDVTRMVRVVVPFRLVRLLPVKLGKSVLPIRVVVPWIARRLFL